MQASTVAAEQQTAPAPESLTVVYTGRTIGYARACREEVLKPKGAKTLNRRAGSSIRLGVPSFDVPLYERVCVKWDPNQPEYGSLLKMRIDAARGGAKRALTVGVGDHFALEYGARTMRLEPDGKPSVRVSKDELYYHSGAVPLADQPDD
jgi:hypothetical protein